MPKSGRLLLIKSMHNSSAFYALSGNPSKNFGGTEKNLSKLLLVLEEGCEWWQLCGALGGSLCLKVG